jgi:hypothetical protein
MKPLRCRYCARYEVRFRELYRDAREQMRLFGESGDENRLLKQRVLHEQATGLSERWIEHVKREHESALRVG